MKSIAIQPTLNLRIAARTVLVTTGTVRASLGIDADSIVNMVDCGELRWVWDISCGMREIRELRFWTRELVAPEACAGLETAAVISLIIGTQREHLRAGEVAQLLLCSRPHLLYLLRAGHLTGPLVGHTQHVTRASLAEFFRSRLIGADLPTAVSIRP